MVLALLVSAPLFQLVRTLRQDPYPYFQSPLIQNVVIRESLLATDRFLKPVIKLYYDDLSGGPYAINIYSIRLTEPLTALLYAAHNSIQPAAWDWIYFFSAALPLLFALFLGRVYCGYICPMSLIVSLNLRLQKKHLRRSPGFNPGYSASVRDSGPGRLKLFLLLGLFLILALNPLLLQYVLPPAQMQHGLSDFILFGGLSLWSTLFFLTLLLEVFKPAYFCRKLCPTGLFLTFAPKKRLFSLAHKKGVACEKGCLDCNEECWLGLNPKANPDDEACDLCIAA